MATNRHGIDLPPKEPAGSIVRTRTARCGRQHHKDKMHKDKLHMHKKSLAYLPLENLASAAARNDKKV